MFFHSLIMSLILPILLQNNTTCFQNNIDFPNIEENHLISNEEFFLRIPGVAKYHVHAPTNTITFDPDPSLRDPALIHTWLNGTVLAYLLQYHGYLVLHGAAIVLSDQAVLFTGNSGAGKSTLAMAMALCGYSIITDDLIVIRATPSNGLEIIPTSSNIKLWADSLAKFGKNTQGLSAVLSKPGKFSFPLQNSWKRSIPIAAIYELQPKEGLQEFKLVPVKGVEAIKLLIRNTYRYAMLKPLGKLGVHLQQINQLINTCKLYQVSRPTCSFQPHLLADFIVSNFQKEDRNFAK